MIIIDIKLYQKMRTVETRKLATWKTKVCCWGWMQYGKSIWPPIGSCILTYLPTITLTVDLAISDYWFLTSIFILLQIGVLVTMLLVLSTDPGILPQIIHRYESDKDLLQIPSRIPQQQHKYLLTQASLLHAQKYCYECNIYRPIRSVHCGSCNHCVERYDHHCPWLAICIGKYNYKYFLLYLSSLIVLILYTLINGICSVVRNAESNHWPADYIAVILVTILAGIFFFPLARLLLYHVQIMRKGLTTNEDLRHTYQIIHDQLPFPALDCSIRPNHSYPILSSYQYQTKNYVLDNLSSANTQHTPSTQHKQRSILSSLVENVEEI